MKIKVDIQGSEVSVIRNVQNWKSVSKLVFEYDFEYSPDLASFHEFIQDLKAHFPYIHHSKLPLKGKFRGFPNGVIVFAKRESPAVWTGDETRVFKPEFKTLKKTGRRPNKDDTPHKKRAKKDVKGPPFATSHTYYYSCDGSGGPVNEREKFEFQGTRLSIKERDLATGKVYQLSGRVTDTKGNGNRQLWWCSFIDPNEKDVHSRVSKWYDRKQVEDMLS